MSRRGRHFDVIVIGAGLSGLTAANFLSDAGVRVGVIAKGGGFLHFTSGCVDVLARASDGKPISDPLVSVEDLIVCEPRHPYARAGRDHLRSGLHRFRQMMAEADLSFVGDDHTNLTLPTAIGSTRSTYLAPETMVEGSMRASSAMLIVGFRGFRDFYPPYLAANLSRIAPFPVRHLYLDVPGFRNRRHLLPLDVARGVDNADTREEIARLVKANLGDAGRVGFPAVLGLDCHPEAIRHLSILIGHPLFEIPTLPPSVAGIRINGALRRRLLRGGTRVEIGFWAQGRLEGNRATEIVVDSAGGATTHTADAFVLATGGTGGGGISAHHDGTLRETVFGLPVEGPQDRNAWYHARFLGPDPQPISLAGVAVNERLQPQPTSDFIIENIFVTAANLPHWDPVHEGSGEGVALATADRAATEVLSILGGHHRHPLHHPVNGDSRNVVVDHISSSRAASLDH